MDFDLSDDHVAIQRLVRDFAVKEVAPVAEELDRTKSFPYDIVRKLGDLGLMGIPFPEEYGGAGGPAPAPSPPAEGRPRGDSPRASTRCAPPPPGPPPADLFGAAEQ